MPNPPLIYFLSLLFLFSSTSIFLILPSNAQVDNSTSSSSSSAACKNTLYPKLCRSITSSIRYSPSDPYNYGKISIKRCLKQARKLSQVINHFLQKQRNSLTHIEANALEDCYELSQLSVGYFDSIGEELKVAETLNEELVDRVETLLSAIVTNQQTCVDGLMILGNGILHRALAAPLSNVTKLYSVSLGLVTNALARNIKKKFKKRKGSHRDGSSRKGHPFREPLDTLIKALHKSSCKTSKACKRGERVLGEMEGNGILISDTVIVSQNGTDNFTTIGDAIAIAPNNSKPEDGYFVIYAREGYYEEYIVIPKNKKNILLLGDGINQTIITGNHSYVDGWTTYNSSTFAVAGERFIAIDMTFRNTAGPIKHQAVAVRNNADISTFYRCSFEGYQDTLYVHSLRQFYRECDIYGTVDFIFGNAAAVFQNCNLYARKPLPDQKNAFTAQGRTDPNQNTGISIHNCSIEAAPDLAMDLNSTLTYLGRPWKVYSRTVIMQSYISEVINPVGWLEWNGTIGLDTLYYGEFENFGPRANTSTRVQWPGYNLMNVSQAVNFTVYNLTLGDTWLPYTDIPFNAGLLH